MQMPLKNLKNLKKDRKRKAGNKRTGKMNKKRGKYMSLFYKEKFESLKKKVFFLVEGGGGGPTFKKKKIMCLK